VVAEAGAVAWEALTDRADLLSISMTYKCLVLHDNVRLVA
jgi:hypothetical protein